MTAVSITYELAAAPLAEQITDSLVLVTLSRPVVANFAYYAPSAYELTWYNAETFLDVPVTIRRVLPTKDRTTTQILLEVDRLQEGREYDLTTAASTVPPWDGGYEGDLVDMGGGGGSAVVADPPAISSSDGAAFSFSLSFVARRTKASSMLRAIPAHFNKSPTGIIHAILSAIGLQDEQLGGSRSDTIGAGTETLTYNEGTNPYDVATCTTYLLESVMQTLGAGDTVNGWGDFSAVANDYANGGAIGTHPVLDGVTDAVSFDGADDSLTCTKTMGDTLDTDGYTCYYVVTLDALAFAGPEDDAAAGLHIDSTDTSWGVLVASSGGISRVYVLHQQAAAPNTRKYTPSIPMLEGVEYCVRVRYDGSSVYLRCNGTEVSVAASALSTTRFGTNNLTIGQGSESLAVTVRHLSTFDSALSQDDMDGIDTWLRFRFDGITL